MQAVVMAGGEGSRLRPLTLGRPKPMLPVVNRPVLGHILYLLKRHGISDVVLTLQYLAAQIQDYYGDGKALGMHIEYVVEESPLGTAGSVKNAETLLAEHAPFLVISGDALTDFDLSALIRYHRDRSAALTMALYRVQDPLEYGVINVHEDGRVAHFLEKPNWGGVTSDTVNTGIYIVQPEVLARIPSGQRVDWSQDVFPAMMARGDALYGYTADGYWCDIGTISEYSRANADLLNGRLYLGELGTRIGPDVWSEGTVDIAPDAQLIGPIYLGDEVKINRGAIVHGPTVIRDYTVMDDRSRVSRSIIWRNCYIGEGVALHGAVVGRQCSFKAHSMVRLGAAFGSILPKNSTVTINRDPHRSPRMIKRALISGLPSAGINVMDLQTLPIPVARYYTRTRDTAGGIHVRLSPYDQRVVDIRFIDHDGLDLTHEQERNIERVFFREDYRRAYLDDIGNIEYAPDAVAVYGEGYLQALDQAAIRAAGLKIVVDYAHAPAADIMPRLLDALLVESVPLNARVEASKVSIPQDEFRARREQLARITQVVNDISLGVRLDVGGEKMFIADDQGNTVSDPVMCAAMAALVFRTCPGSTVIVTVDQPLLYERLAERYGGHVRRCPTDPQALMKAAVENGATMAGDGTGYFSFPALHPAIDSLFALGKLLEMLARQRTRLSDVIADLPPFYMATGRVEGVWESKGRIMRSLIQQFTRLRVETADGIKIYLNDDEWVLIRPENDTAAYHLVAEARSPQAAQEIIADYGGIVHSHVKAPYPDENST